MKRPAKRRGKRSVSKDLPAMKDKGVKGGALNIGTRLAPSPPPIIPVLAPVSQPTPPPIMPRLGPEPPPI